MVIEERFAHARERCRCCDCFAPKPCLPHLVSHTLSPTPCPHTLSPTPCLPHLVPTPCPHTLSPHLVSTLCRIRFVPTLCPYALSKESIESMDSNDSILSDCSILSIRSTTTSRRRRHYPLSRLLSPVSCLAPVPNHPAGGTSVCSSARSSACARSRYSYSRATHHATAYCHFPSPVPRPLSPVPCLLSPVS